MHGHDVTITHYCDFRRKFCQPVPCATQHGPACFPRRVAVASESRTITNPWEQRVMNITLVLCVTAACAFAMSSAHAGLSQLNATCPGGLDVHVDDGGPVYVNGKEAKLKRTNDNYFEATDTKTGTVISISKNPDGSSSVSY